MAFRKSAPRLGETEILKSELPKCPTSTPWSNNYQFRPWIMAFGMLIRIVGGWMFYHEVREMVLHT